MLHDRRERHTHASENETPGNARDGVHRVAVPTQERVDDFVEDGDEEDDYDGVDVLHLVVGHAVEFHLPGLRDEVRVQLVVDDPEDGVEEEDFAGDEAAAELVGEGFRPGGFVLLAMGWEGGC